MASIAKRLYSNFNYIRVRSFILDGAPLRNTLSIPKPADFTPLTRARIASSPNCHDAAERHARDPHHVGVGGDADQAEESDVIMASMRA